jgi:energy-coupling factor transporter ATP-binding protein EcfA2
MYKSFYNLKRNPFDITPDPSFLFATRRHNEALAALYYGVRRHKGFVVLTGEVGTGKTVLLHCLLQLFRHSKDVAYAYIFNGRLSPLEFLQFFASDLGLSVGNKNKGELLIQIAHYLIGRSQKNLTTALIVDEAHHLLPTSWSPVEASLPRVLENTIFITVHPEQVAKPALQMVDVVLGIGDAEWAVFASYADLMQIHSPQYRGAAPKSGEALAWFPKSGEDPLLLEPVRGSRERLRHVRQYAEGELSPQQSFFFRGPESKLNLRAQNLRSFLQLAEGVDDETWMFHLRRGDFSSWFRTIIKDEELAREAAQIERDEAASPEESRARIREAVDTRYTASA